MFASSEQVEHQHDHDQDGECGANRDRHHVVGDLVSLASFHQAKLVRGDVRLNSEIMCLDGDVELSVEMKLDLVVTSPRIATTRHDRFNAVFRGQRRLLDRARVVDGESQREEFPSLARRRSGKQSWIGESEAQIVFSKDEIHLTFGSLNDGRLVGEIKLFGVVENESGSKLGHDDCMIEGVLELVCVDRSHGRQRRSQSGGRWSQSGGRWSRSRGGCRSGRLWRRSGRGSGGG